jgi:hypothetical protein
VWGLGLGFRVRRLLFSVVFFGFGVWGLEFCVLVFGFLF